MFPFGTRRRIPTNTERRAAGAPPEVSRNVMIRMRPKAWATVVSGMRRSLSGGGFRYSVRFRRLGVFGMGFPFEPSSFRHPRRRRRPGCGGTLIRAYRVCARARAGGRFAPARFARLIARARRRAHLSRQLPGGLFAPAAPTRDEAASGCRFLPPAPYCYRPSGNQVSRKKYFKKENEIPIRSP